MSPRRSRGIDRPAGRLPALLCVKELYKALRQAAVLVLPALLPGCLGLEEIQLGICGNGVHEPANQEDCDGFAAEPETSCGAAGQPAACRYHCAVDAEGERPRCPSGWGCGQDDICREHSARYEEARPLAIPAGRWLEVEDFDGDGFDDVAWAHEARVQVDYLVGGAPVATAEAPYDNLGQPQLADLNGDGLPDWLLPSDLGLSVWRSQAARVLAPTTFTSIPLESTVRGFVAVDLVPDIVLIQGEPRAFAGDESLVISVAGLSTLNRAVTIAEPLGGDLSKLLRPVLAAELDGAGDEELLPPGSATPQEIVAAFLGDDFVTVFRPQLVAVGASEIAVSLLKTKPTRVELDGAKVARLLAATHLNAQTATGGSALPCQTGVAPADEHLDLLLMGADDRVYAAFGLGDGTFLGSPCELEGAVADNVARPLSALAACSAVLAVGDLDADGALDVVAPGGIWLSGLGGGVTTASACEKTTPHLEPPGTEPWTEAIIADFDGDGDHDVIAAAARDGLDLYVGTGEPTMSYRLISGTGRASTLNAGDYDGNGIVDLAFTAKLGALDEEDTLSLLFGEPDAAPAGPLRLGAVDTLLVLAPLDLPNASGIADAATDLLLSAGQVGRAALIVGRPDRLLEAPFVQAYAFDRSAHYRPITAAAGRFTGASQEVALIGKIWQDPDAVPPYSIGIADVLGDLELVLRGERQAIDVAQGKGAFTVSLVMDIDAAPGEAETEDELVVLTSTGDEAGSEIRLAVARANAEGPWEVSSPLVLTDRLYLGTPIEDEHLLAPWSAATVSGPRACQLDAGAGPALVFTALRRGPCQGGSGADLESVVYVIDAATLRDVIAGDASLPEEALLEGPAGETIVSVTCLNGDGDTEDELAILTLNVPLRACDDELIEKPPGGLRARLYLQQRGGGEVGELMLLKEIDASRAPSLGSAIGAIPPVSGLGAGDVDGDGVADSVVGTNTSTLLLRGLATQP